MCIYMVVHMYKHRYKIHYANMICPIHFLPKTTSRTWQLFLDNYLTASPPNLNGTFELLVLISYLHLHLYCMSTPFCTVRQFIYSNLGNCVKMLYNIWSIQHDWIEPHQFLHHMDSPTNAVLHTYMYMYALIDR